MCESVGKADLLSDHFDSKQYRESVDLPLTCHHLPHLPFQPPSLLIVNIWVPALLCVTHTMQSALKSRQEARIEQIIG